jgi:4-hydroxyphenylacetate 3-monooxygenase
MRDGREVWIDGERVKDPPAIRRSPIIDVRARICDMQREPAHAPVLIHPGGQPPELAFSTGCRRRDRG